MTDSDPFAALYNQEPTVHASAPGRVNLIGEHTDYNGGFVLPMALPHRTRVSLAARDDRQVRAASAQRSGVQFYELGHEARTGQWLDYVKGINFVLAARGHAITGFNLYIDSDVPVGAGLSSSAALEVALLRGLRELFSLPFDDLALAALAHQAETEFVGVPVGVMDPIACSLGDTDSALAIDTRTLAIERIALPPGFGLVVIDSGVDHTLAVSEYRVRRRECEQAAALLGAPQLRDVDPSDPRIAALPDPLPRRVRHVVSENARVLAAARALRDGDLVGLGGLFDASHQSMRDDFEVSIPEIDLLVRLARRLAPVLGARLTGGGFGGSVIVLTPDETTARVAAEVASDYAAAVPHQPVIVLPR